MTTGSGPGHAIHKFTHEERKQSPVYKTSIKNLRLNKKNLTTESQL